MIVKLIILIVIIILMYVFTMIEFGYPTGRTRIGFQNEVPDNDDDEYYKLEELINSNSDQLEINTLTSMYKRGIKIKKS